MTHGNLSVFLAETIASKKVGIICNEEVFVTL